MRGKLSPAGPDDLVLTVTSSCARTRGGAVSRIFRRGALVTATNRAVVATVPGYGATIGFSVSTRNDPVCAHGSRDEIVEAVETTQGEGMSAFAHGEMTTAA